jgi:DNA-binding MarR family transcriptional regulator
VTNVARTSDLSAICPSTDERVLLFGLLLETNARLERQLGASLEDATGLPLAWFEVLLRIHRAEGGFLSMSSLASQTVYSSGGTTRLIDRIEAQGLVVRGACPSDRRGVHVRLTELGEATLTKALEVHVTHLDEFVTSKLTAAEREGLETALRKLNGGPPTCAGTEVATELTT